jgi:hypothetical protein
MIASLLVSLYCVIGRILLTLSEAVVGCLAVYLWHLIRLVRGIYSSPLSSLLERVGLTKLLLVGFGLPRITENTLDRLSFTNRFATR